MTGDAIKIVDRLRELEHKPTFGHTLESLQWWIDQQLGKLLTEPSGVRDPRELRRDFSHPAMPGACQEGQRA